MQDTETGKILVRSSTWCVDILRAARVTGAAPQRRLSEAVVYPQVIDGRIPNPLPSHTGPSGFPSEAYNRGGVPFWNTLHA